MRFGANLLRGARPIPLDRPIPGTGAGAPPLGAVLARHRTPLLLGGAGAVVALGLLHRRKATTSASAPDLAAMGDPAANGATVAGYTPADTSGTDVYNALQPQIEETQGMLAQLLGAIGAGSLLPSSSGTAGGSAAPAAGGRRPGRRPRAAAKPRGKAKGRAHAKAKAKKHQTDGRPRSRFSTLAPAARAVPRRAASPAPHKAVRDTAHVVRKGETAASIARKHGTNAAAVHQANSRLQPAKVAPGRRVVVPNPKARRR